MNSILRHIILFCLVINCSYSFAQYDLVHKTEKLLYKEKYDNAFQNIRKSIEKDSLNAVAYQALAVYYTHLPNPNYHVDSAHDHNLTAIQHYEFSDEKTIQKLEKNEFTSPYLIRFKKDIDSLAFQEARARRSIEGYNHFIELYTTSDLMDAAIVMRNQLAFDKARDENTYHSYRAFMERYPNATQIEEAKARFEKLYYDESVKDGQLKSYYNFLEEHPQSVYRPLAELEILEMSTINNSLSSYLKFVEMFPASSHAKTALDYAYHISEEVPQIDISNDGYYDSLLAIHRINQEVLVPYYNNGFGFINSQGKTIIPITYKIATQQPSKCPILFNDFIWAETAGNDVLLTKAGKAFWNGKYDAVEDMGKGLIALTKNTQRGVIHKSGKQILDIIYDDIKIVGRQYIAYQDQGLWGLTTALGRQITRPIYEDIIARQDFVLFKADGKWAVSNLKTISQSLNKSLDLSFDYTDYDAFDKENLMVYENDKINIMSINLSPVLHASTTYISTNEEGLITQDDRGYHLIDFHSKKELASSAEPILSNKLGAFYQDNGKWNHWKDQHASELPCDSLALLGSHFIQYYQGDSIRFSPYSQLAFPRKVPFTSVNKNNESYLLIKKDESTILLDTIGQILILEAYDKISLAGDSLLIVEQNNLKGLLTSKGGLVLDIEFDAIQRNDSVTFTLLRDSKFGIYNQVDSTQIPPTYTRKITPYDSTLYIAHYDDHYGLIDHEGNTVLPFAYDEIQYWNNFSALVKKGYQWIIVNIQDNEPVIDQIDQFSNLPSNTKGSVLKIFKENGFGLLSSEKGLLITSSFYNIHQIQQEASTIYIAEKFIEEADFYVLVYYNSEGHVIFKHAMEAKDYQSLDCETD